MYTFLRSGEPIHPENFQYIQVKVDAENVKLYDGTNLIEPSLSRTGFYEFLNPFYNQPITGGLYIVINP